MKKTHALEMARAALSVLISTVMVVSSLLTPALVTAVVEATPIEEAEPEETVQIEEVPASNGGEEQDGLTPTSTAFEVTQTVDGVRVAVKAEAGAFVGAESLVVERADATQEALAQSAVEAERESGATVADSYTFDVKPKSSSLRPANSRERKQRTVSRLRVLPKRRGRQTRVTESPDGHQSRTTPVLST